MKQKRCAHNPSGGSGGGVLGVTELWQVHHGGDGRGGRVEGGDWRGRARLLRRASRYYANLVKLRAGQTVL